MEPNRIASSHSLGDEYTLGGTTRNIDCIILSIVLIQSKGALPNGSYIVKKD